MKTIKAGRNDPCPCGSGKKFKRCCEKRTKNNRFATVMTVLVAAALLGGVAFALTALTTEGSSSPAPGRVWSPEHGHWH